MYIWCCTDQTFQSQRRLRRERGNSPTRVWSATRQHALGQQVEQLLQAVQPFTWEGGVLAGPACRTTAPSMVLEGSANALPAAAPLCGLEGLSDDTLAQIFRRLELCDILTAACVCRRFRAIVYVPQLHLLLHSLCVHTTVAEWFSRARMLKEAYLADCGVIRAGTTKSVCGDR